MRGRFEARQARVRDELAEVNVARGRADYLPDVSLQFLYLGLYNIDFLPKNMSLVGLSFQWEPFDWGRKSHVLQERHAAAQQAKIAIKEAEEQIRMDVAMKYRKLNEARA